MLEERLPGRVSLPAVGGGPEMANRWNLGKREALTSILPCVDAVRLPGWDPRDPSKRWLKSGDIVQPRGQRRFLLYTTLLR